MRNDPAANKSIVTASPHVDLSLFLELLLILYIFSIAFTMESINFKSMNKFNTIQFKSKGYIDRYNINVSNDDVFSQLNRFKDQHQNFYQQRFASKLVQ